MNRKKKILLVVLAVTVTASGCLNDSSDLESIEYSPPEGFESTLAYPNPIINEIAPEKPGSYQTYRDSNHNYIYAGKMKIRAENLHTEEGIRELEMFLENKSSGERNGSETSLDVVSSGRTTLNNNSFVQVKAKGAYILDMDNRETSWNWTETMFFREEKDSVYGFILVKTDDYYTTNDRSDDSTDTTPSNLYDQFIESVSSSKIRN